MFPRRMFLYTNIVDGKIHQTSIVVVWSLAVVFSGVPRQAAGGGTATPANNSGNHKRDCAATTTLYIYHTHAPFPSGSLMPSHLTFLYHSAPLPSVASSPFRFPRCHSFPFSLPLPSIPLPSTPLHSPPLPSRPLRRSSSPPLLPSRPLLPPPTPRRTPAYDFFVTCFPWLSI
jgi:hypothetical protein